MAEPYSLGVAEAAKQMRDRQLSPVALAQSLLDRIEALDPTLKAWVTIDREEVLTTARQREQELERKGAKGLVYGVPVGLKDIFYTAGMKTSACSRIYADFVPAYDATVVTRLKEAGAIILGKAVTTEFASSDPSPTRNPWRWLPGCARRPWVLRPAVPPAAQLPITASWDLNQPTDVSAATGSCP